ncbi:DNA polymerase I [Hydrogenophilus islandicus]
MTRLVLVDGSSFLYRAFHALPDLRTAAGEPTGAIRGVVTMLHKLESRYPAEYRACIFDAPGPTFRDELFADYKAHRPPMPEALQEQIATLHALVPLMGWPLIVQEGVEADDVIATLTREARERGWEVVIATGDKDLTQLVRDGVLWVDTMRDETLDEAGVIAKFGVTPAQIPDYLALVGDTVDNIPGVPGCGPKTAAKWLQRFGSLDHLIAHADEISGQVGEKLRQALAWLPKARELTTVRSDVPLPFTVDALTARPVDWPALRRWFDRLEFRTLSKQFAAEHPDALSRETPQAPVPSPAPELLDAKEVPAPPPSALEPPDAAEARRARYRTILTRADLDALAERLATAAATGQIVAFDTETTSLDARNAALVGLSFAFAEGDAVYLPVGHRLLDGPQQLSLEEVRAALAPWFADPAAPKVAQNAKFDLHVLHHHGMSVAGTPDDTMLIDYVLESDREHDLDRLSERELHLTPLTYSAVCGSGKNAISFADVAIPVATRYAAEDADLTWRLYHHLRARLAQLPPLERVYEQIERPLVPVLTAIERVGIKIDTAQLRAQSERFAALLADLEARATKLAGRPFNLASPKQVAELLFHELGLKPPKKTATGQASTSEEALALLADRLDPATTEYQLIATLLEHRRLAKLKNTYLDKLPQMVDPATGRVHTTFSQGAVVTGRLSSSDPNLQNIPVRTEEGRAIRRAFVAEEGYRLISADYSQIELRIMAHLSGDQALIDAFARGEDIHRHTAAELLNKPLDAVTPDERRLAKTINFGLIYGMGAPGLARSLGLSRKEAEETIARYFARYPGVARYMERARQNAREQGYVETLFGRRLWLRQIHSQNANVRAADERAAINAPMQGTAADLIKLAMIDLAASLAEHHPRARIVLQVHDELLVEAPEAECAAVAERVKSDMEGVATRHAAAFAIEPLAVPLVVDVGVGQNWDEAH